MNRSLTAFLAFLWPLMAKAVLFHDTASSTHNNSAPIGPYLNSGWQYQGLFGGFMGTAISPTHFITAQHIGVADSIFAQPTYLTGNAAVNHTIDTSVNGGTGYWNISGTDLRIFQITGSTFTDYAPLYTGTDETGKTGVVIGRGGPRGGDVMLGPDLKGWYTGGGDGVVRWGLNTVSGGYTDSGVGDLLYADFDNVSGVEEAHLSVGDSGGAFFLDDGGTWKLAGINYAVDGRFSFNSDGSSPFSAALFDIGGLYIESSPSWVGVPDPPQDLPSSFYVSRISSHAAAISAIAVIPEPSSALLVGVACAGWTLRRRRQ
jgi:hypothetical protein